jgi:hypothetical protein
MIYPPLSQPGKAALRPSYKPMSKEQARKETDHMNQNHNQ